MKQIIAVASWIVLSVMAASCQTAVHAVEFEVASVKPAPGSSRFPAGGLAELIGGFNGGPGPKVPIESLTRV